jgi:drug/metabolite transporter (DMT)-like permease
MSRHRQTIATASGFVLLSSCAFGSLSTLTVLLTRHGLPLLPAMFWRYLLAAAALLALLRGRVVKDISRNNAVRLMMVGGIGQSLITYLSLYALEFLPVGPLAFLFYTYPAWVAAISAILGREDITLARLVALSIAMLGIVIMVGAPGATHLHAFGVFLALGTALLYALYLPSLNYVQRDIPAAVSSFYLICGVLAVFFVASIVTQTLRIPATTEIWGYLTLVSLFSTVVAFTSLIAGLRVLGPVRTSIIATIEPFFTALLGTLLLDEVLTRSIFAGGAIIAGAVLLLQVTAKDSPARAVNA